MEDPIRFGAYELDTVAGELRKSGIRAPLSGQPLDVLALLLRRPGELVTREELQEALWSGQTIVDFDNGLNSAIRRIRRALDDSATEPRFIETLPKRGYRFVGSVEQASPAPEVRQEPGKSDSAAAEALSLEATLPAQARDAQRRGRWAPLVLAATLGAVVIALAANRFTQVATELPLRRFSLATPPNLDTSRFFAGPVISPNGKHIAFTTTGTQGRLWVQDLNQDEPRALAGTDGAILPFWSPESERIGFGAGGELKEISVRGGPSRRVCLLPAPYYQGSWSPDGETIVFSAGSTDIRLYEVSVEGGTPEPLFSIHDLGMTGMAVARPAFLPLEGTRILLFIAGDYSNSKMYARNLETGQMADLGIGDRPVYSASSGHLIYQAASNTYNLWARAFSASTLEFTGSAFALRKNARQPSLSMDGTLVYQDGSGGANELTLAWRNREGSIVKTVGPPQLGLDLPALSPDGQRVAMRSEQSGGRQIWVHDLTREAQTRVTFEAAGAIQPTWSPSGMEIAYAAVGSGLGLVRKGADGTGKAVPMAEGGRNPDWSRDGRYLVFRRDNGTETHSDICYLELQPDGAASEPKTYLATKANETMPKLSPDGRFLAYVSDELGRNEVYVRPFPEAAGGWRVSEDGGAQPRWRADGRELYYVEDGTALMAVPVSTETDFEMGKPIRLFASPDLKTDGSRAAPGYDVSADGQRFLTVAPLNRQGEANPAKIRVVQNWLQEFRNR